MTNKINGLALDSGAISVDVLKSVSEGDMVVMLTDEGECALCTVISRIARKGRNGGTSLVLSDIAHPATTYNIPNTNTLPDGIQMVRKVLDGVNERTKRKLSALASESVAVSEQPITIALPELASEPADIALPAAPVQDAPTDLTSRRMEVIPQDTDALIAEIMTIGS